MSEKKNLGHNTKKSFLNKPVEHIDITSFDSRKIKQGMLFALIKENNKYISDALKFGAKAVLCKKTDINNLNNFIYTPF